MSCRSTYERSDRQVVIASLRKQALARQWELLYFDEAGFSESGD
jgi:hypothetical protein